MIVTVDRPLAAVPEKSITSIAVTDFDLDYTVGDEFAGGKVLAVYSDGTTETVELTAEMVSGFDTAATGKKTVTVTYGGKTVTVEIEVVAATEAPDNGNTSGGNEENNASGGNTSTDSGKDKGCGSAIAFGTCAAAAGVIILRRQVIGKSQFIRRGRGFRPCFLPFRDNSDSNPILVSSKEQGFAKCMKSE